MAAYLCFRSLLAFSERHGYPFQLFLIGLLNSAVSILGATSRDLSGKCVLNSKTTGRWNNLSHKDSVFQGHTKIALSSLSLKLYLNSLVYHRNIFGSSSKVFSNLRTSSENFRKMFGKVRLAFGAILEKLRKSSKSGRKSSENRQKRRHQFVYVIKRTLRVSSKISILCSRGKNNISLVRCAHSWDIALATRT